MHDDDFGLNRPDCESTLSISGESCQLSMLLVLEIRAQSVIQNKLVRVRRFPLFNPSLFSTGST